MTAPETIAPSLESGDMTRLGLVAQLAVLLSQVDEDSSPAEIAHEAGVLVCHSTPGMRRFAAKDLEALAAMRSSGSLTAHRISAARAAAAFLRSLDPMEVRRG